MRNKFLSGHSRFEVDVLNRKKGAMTRYFVRPKRLPFFLFLRIFLYLIVIILIEENKKIWPYAKITRNEQKFRKITFLILNRIFKNKKKYTSYEKICRCKFVELI